MLTVSAAPTYLFERLICPMLSPFSLPGLWYSDHFPKCLSEHTQSVDFQLCLVKLTLQADATIYSSSLFQILATAGSFDGLNKSLKASYTCNRQLVLLLLSWSVPFILSLAFY